MRRPDYIHKHYNPLLQKSLRNALARRIRHDFPRIGGSLIAGVCADMLLEVFSKHVRPRDTIRHGQLLWLGISIDDPPSRDKTTADTELVPVVLDLSTDEDIEARLARQTPRQRLTLKAVRLCEQAHRQGALLSNCDLAEMLGANDSVIAAALAQYERSHNNVVPRRATLHDVGTGVTHKGIICRKRYREGKMTDQIARETHHTSEAVDRYLGQFDRVRHCRQQGFTPDQTAFALKCTVGLVLQYLALDDELTPALDPSPPSGSQSPGRPGG